MKRFFLYSALACGVVFGVGSSARAGELPKAEVVLDKEAEAAGGKAAAEKIKTASLKAKISAGDVKIDVLLQFGPEKYYKALAVDGIRSEEFVVVGDVAWKNDSITGAELLQGEERSKVVREAAELAGVFRRIGNWRQQYKAVKCVAEETIEGKAAYKVELTEQDGATRINHYDKESGLLIRSETTMESPEGKGKLVEYYSDYRKVDGITHAFTTRIVAGEAEIVVTIDQIEHNIDLPKERFTLPAELKKLLKQQ